jgi:integrase
VRVVPLHRNADNESYLQVVQSPYSLPKQGTIIQEPKTNGIRRLIQLPPPSQKYYWKLCSDAPNMQHTVATPLLSKEINPKIVQEHLGHASIHLTLNTYSYVIKSMKGIVANALEDVVGSD